MAHEQTRGGRPDGRHGGRYLYGGPQAPNLGHRRLMRSMHALDVLESRDKVHRGTNRAALSLSLARARGTPAVEAYPVIPTYGSRAAGACWRIDVRVEYENTKCSGES